MSSFLYGQSQEGKTYLEFTWTNELTKMTRNASGSTGWAHIHRRSGGHTNSPPFLCRVHICRHDPCDAIWSAAKYGLVPPPIHVTQVLWNEALEADLNGEFHGAGGEPLDLTDLTPLPLPHEPSPVADACLHSGESLGQLIAIDGHCAESQGAEDPGRKQWLQWMEPFAVNDPLKEEVPAAVAAVPEEVPAAVAAVPEEVLAAVTAVPVQQIEPTSAPLHLLRPGEAIDAASVIPQASCAVSLPMAALSLLPSHHSNLLNRVSPVAFAGLVRTVDTWRLCVSRCASACWCTCGKGHAE